MNSASRRPRARRREVIVFTEGEVTEVSYVDAIKRLQHRFVVRVDDRHGCPGMLVPLAIGVKRTKDDESQQEGLDKDEWPHVWCLFDRDEHAGVDALIDQATASGVQVAFSHPCFELWLLLHFRDHGAPHGGSCGGVTELLCASLPEYKKRGKRVSLGDVAGHYTAARRRAVLLGKKHGRDGLMTPVHRDPSTTMHEFVDGIGVSY